MTSAASAIVDDGRHDFDFLFGSWNVVNRKLSDPLVDGGGEWEQFAAATAVQPILGGLGNIDLFSAPDFPRRPGFEAASLRLFDPETGLWKIWWLSTAAPGALDEPVCGGFGDGRGVFECEDVLAGRPTKVRYEWRPGEADARWEQSFSFDAGETWQANWVMELTREGS
jgi:hypothetical protein